MVTTRSPAPAAAAASSVEALPSIGPATLLDNDLAPWRQTARYYFFPIDDRKIRRKRDQTDFVDQVHRFDVFGALSMAVVLLNLVALALYDPTGTNQSDALSQALTNLEYFFAAFFTFETLMRILCLGARPVFTKPWNLLDVFVVVSSVLALLLQSAFPQLTSVSGLRAIRVLRPLRAFSRIPEIRVVINSMVKSLRYLADVGTLYVLFVVAMGCAGIALFLGQLQRRCVRNELFLFDLVNASDVAAAFDATTARYSGDDNCSTRAAYAAALVNLSLTYVEHLSIVLAANRSSQMYLPTRADWTASSVLDPMFVLQLLSGNATSAAFVCGAYVDQALQGIESSVAAVWVTHLANNINTSNASLAFQSCGGASSSENSSSSSSSSSNVTEALGTQYAAILAGAVGQSDWTGARACDPYMTCDAGDDPLDFFFGYACPYGYTCTEVANPFFGYFGFDHFGEAVLTVLTTVTTETFPQLLYFMSGATSKLSGAIYGVLLIVVGTLFIVNLLVALISVEFEKCRTEEVERRLQERLIQHVAAAKDGKSLSGDGSTADLSEGQEHRSKPCDSNDGSKSSHHRAAGSEKTPTLLEKWLKRFTAHRRQRSHRHKSLLRLLGASAAAGPQQPSRSNVTTAEHHNAWQDPLIGGAHGGDVGGLPAALAESSVATPLHRTPSSNNHEKPLQQLQQQPPHHSMLLPQLTEADVTSTDRFRYFLHTHVVNTRPFFFITSFLMILMLLSMSVNFYGMPDAMAEALDIIDLFFTVCITVEMTLRFFAADPILFFTNAEQITGVIVLVVSWADVASGSFNLPVIRALRLVVAVKLLRYFPTLYGHLMIIVQSFRASLVLVFVIGLELFIFACLGMQMFGGRGCDVEPSQSVVTVEAGIPVGLNTNSSVIVNGSRDVFLSSATADGGGTLATSLLCAPQRLNFDTIGYAMLTSFSILASDNWNDVMYRAMSTYTSPVATAAVALVFCMQYYTGVYVLLNLFIAILMSSTEKLFSEPLHTMTEEELELIGIDDDVGDDDAENEDEEEEDEFTKGYVRKASSSGSGQRRAQQNSADDIFNLGFFARDLENGDADSGVRDIDLTALQQQDAEVGLVQSVANKYAVANNKSKLPMKAAADSPDAAATTPTTAKRRHSSAPANMGGGDGMSGVVSHVMRLTRRADVLKLERRLTTGQRRHLLLEELNMKKKAAQENAVVLQGGVALVQYRLLCVLDHPLANGFMILVVVVSTVALALENVTLPPDHPKIFTLSVIDDVCSGFFLLEFALRVFAKGPRQTFCGKTPWNYFEVLLVACNIVDLVLSHAFSRERNVAHIVRGLYILRPFRILRRTAGIRVVVRSLMGALQPLKDVITVSLIVYVIFAIMGVQLFQGSMQSCIQTPEARTEDACVAAGNAWGNTGRNFDNLGEAMLSLFIVSSLEQWQDILFGVMDAVAPDVAPVRDANPSAAIYVLTFAVIGGFFFISLFVSVLIRSYQEEKSRMNRISMFLTEEQETWLLTQQTVLASMPLADFLAVPKHEWGRLTMWNRFRARLIQVSLHPVFHGAVNVAVLVAMAGSAIQHYPRSQGFDDALNTVNTVVTAVYLAECLVKMVAVHPELYFSSAWNRFDFMVLLISIVDVVLTYMGTMTSTAGIAKALRLFRAARLLRLAQSSKRLSRIVTQFTHSLFGLLNVSAFLLLLIAAYALACMWTFGSLYKDGQVITVYRNFDSFIDSAFVLMSLLFGGDWTIMEACSQTPSTPVAMYSTGCSTNINSCGNRGFATAIFVTFFIIGRYVLLNIFIAVIVESFQGDERGEGSKHAGTLTESDVKQFVEAWVAFDKDRRLYIYTRELLPMLQSLPAGHPFAAPSAADKRPPDGAPPRTKRRHLIHSGFKTLLFFASLGLEERHGCVEFFDVLTGLIRVGTKCETVDALVEPARVQFERQFRFRLDCRVKPQDIALAEATEKRRIERAAGHDVTDASVANKREVLTYYSAVYLADVWKGCRDLRQEMAEHRRATLLAAAKQKQKLSSPTSKNNAPATGSFWTRWWGAAQVTHSSPPVSQQRAGTGLSTDRGMDVVVDRGDVIMLRDVDSDGTDDDPDLVELEELLLGPRGSPSSSPRQQRTSPAHHGSSTTPRGGGVPAGTQRSPYANAPQTNWFDDRLPQGQRSAPPLPVGPSSPRLFTPLRASTSGQDEFAASSAAPFDATPRRRPLVLTDGTTGHQIVIAKPVLPPSFSSLRHQRRPTAGAVGSPAPLFSAPRQQQPGGSLSIPEGGIHFGGVASRTMVAGNGGHTSRNGSGAVAIDAAIIDENDIAPLWSPRSGISNY